MHFAMKKLSWKWYAVAVFVLLLCTGVIFWTYYPRTTAAQRAFIEKGMLACLEDRGNFWRRTCVKDLADEIQRRMDSTSALRALSVLDDNPPIKYSCHILGHYIGQNLYGETKSVPASFATCSQTIACGEGCFHGAIERYIEETGRSLTGHEAMELCPKDDIHNEITYRACYHGIGHASMLLHDHDVALSLAACDVLLQALQQECQSGVFMEVVFTSGSDAQTAGYHSGFDFNAVCAQLPVRYQAMCYQSQATAVMMTSADRYRAGAGFCAQVPEEYRKTCYRELGGDIVVIATNTADLRNVCSMAPAGEARAGCINEGLYFAIQMEAGNMQKVGAYCDAIIETEDRISCYKSLGVVAAQWDAEKAGDLCAAAPRKNDLDYTNCISGTTAPRL